MAGVLRRLRRRAARHNGAPPVTFRQLAARTGWSRGAIGGYFAGKNLPPTDRFDVLVRLLGATGHEIGMLATARDRVEESRRTRPARATVAARDRERPVSPHQLPPDDAGLVGRERELAALAALLPVESPWRGATVALHGAGGVGKSALALHAAHRLGDRFPDHRLYVDLRGTTRGERPLPPRAALVRILRALDTTAGSAGETETEGEAEAEAEAEADLAARYRELAARRRLLIVLDNAHDVAQVRPLLPAGPHCAALITCRRVVAAMNGTTHLHVPLLSPDDCLTLLGRYAGADRLAADRTAAEAVTHLCGRLPLALRIAGARLAARPGWPVSALATRLADPHRRLDELSYADLAVRPTLESDYEALLAGDEADRRAARTLPLLALPDTETDPLTPREAAQRMGTDHHTAEETLERLVDAQLLRSDAPGHYRFHPLTHLFARELPPKL
nr:helix-turn-helix domain-containing protein [Streptomyces coryli]